MIFLDQPIRLGIEVVPPFPPNQILPECPGVLNEIEHFANNYSIGPIWQGTSSTDPDESSDQVGAFSPELFRNNWLEICPPVPAKHEIHVRNPLSRTANRFPDFPDHHIPPVFE
jgi:hypothetical protein